MSVAIVSRHAATAAEGVLPCAKRMNVEAVDAAVTPTASPRAGGMMGDVLRAVAIVVMGIGNRGLGSSEKGLFPTPYA